MILSKFIEGLNILRKYYKEDGYKICAEHDIFYAYSTDSPLSPEDLQKMIDLGWFQEGLSSGDEFAASDYDPGEGWAAFT